MAKKSTRRRLIVGGVAGVAVIAAGTSALALTGSPDTSYRTAGVERGTVVQTISTTGVVSPIHSSDLDFQVAGTVARVPVKQEQQVTAGQLVARLNRTDLRAALAAAQSTLSTSREALAADEASQSSTSVTTSSTNTSQAMTTPTPTATSTTSSTPLGTSSTSGKHLQADQAALITAQHRADADLAVARNALATEKTACATELATSEASGGADSTDNSTSACTAAAKALYADQSAVSKDQRAVQTAETKLTDDLGSGTGSASSTSGSGAGGGAHVRRAAASTATAAAQRTSPTRATPNSESSSADDRSGSTTVTASSLASDEATIDTDQAAVVTARESLREAVLRSPISGRVTVVTIHRGDQVSGSSSATTPAVEVVGSRQSEVTVGLSAAQVRTVKIGMKARVTADGSSNAVQAAVTSIGIAAAESTTGSSTYPVVIALSRRATSIVSGADAAVTLALAHVRDVLVVPTSAVHRNDTKTYVQTVKDGRLIHTPVKVGAVGTVWTQITSGVSAGRRVVLADLSAKVPSSSSNLDTTGGSGRFRSFTVGGPGGPGGGFGPQNSSSGASSGGSR